MVNLLRKNAGRTLKSYNYKKKYFKEQKKTKHSKHLGLWQKTLHDTLECVPVKSSLGCCGGYGHNKGPPPPREGAQLTML